MAATAEYEGEALIGVTSDAVSLAAELSAHHGVDVRRVLDIGCGPGVATCVLAQRFERAHVLAVDGAAAMLERAGSRAERLGVGHRVETRQVEFPAGLAHLGPADLAWVSLVLHHLGDETAALRQIRELLEPAGLLALVERAQPPRLLPEHIDLGRPGIWERLDDALESWFTDMRSELEGATPSVTYPAMLERAGFELLVDDVLTLDLDAPLGEPARRFAFGQLRRTRTQCAAYADPADLDALDALIDEDSDESILHRDDVGLRASRHLYIVRPRAERD
jgi:SAM-dependent methyltransferase